MSERVDNALEVLDKQFESIRIDEETKQGSVLDVITFVTGMNARNAPKAFTRLDEKTKSECQHLRINGKGKLTPVAPLNVLRSIAIYLVSIARISGHQKEEWLRRLGVTNTIVMKSHIEPDTLRVLIAAFKHLLPETQYSVLNYRIDLYLREPNIAVECDEYGHEHYNQTNEVERVVRITNVLGCKWVRFNPHVPNFNIGDVIYNILFLINSNKF